MIGRGKHEMNTSNRLITPFNHVFTQRKHLKKHNELIYKLIAGFSVVGKN